MIGQEALCVVRFATALQLAICKLVSKLSVQILEEVPKLDLASKTYLSNLGTSASHQTIGFISMLME